MSGVSMQPYFRYPLCSYNWKAVLLALYSVVGLGVFVSFLFFEENEKSLLERILLPGI